MQFAELTSYLKKLELTTSRNKMTVILAELLKKARAGEVDKICYLSLGRLGPKFAALEFNLAEKMMIKALALAFDKGERKIKELYKNYGDLGDVAAELKRKTKNEKRKTKTKNLKLNVEKVFGCLSEVAEEAGEGSVERKIEKMAKLLQELDELSAKYVVRTTLEKLRLGFSDMTILDALSWMVAGDKSRREEIEAAYNVRADVGQIAKLVKKGRLGREGRLGRLGVLLGTPVVPALCQRLPNAEEMIKKMGRVAVEPKYDGTRLQLHAIIERKAQSSKCKAVNIFTRNLDNVTQMFPDIVEALKKEVKAKEIILDGEVVGFDPKTGKLLPFQETIKRKRKHQVQEMLMKIPLKYFCFDILYKDGVAWLGRPFGERRKILEETLRKENKTIVLSPQIVTDEPRVIRRYHDEQIKKGLEGVVLKKLEAAYEPGRRGYTWVKFKSEKRGKRGGGLADTLDCMVMGYYLGKGKRAELGIGAFLVGIRSKLKVDGFLTVSKIGTGLTDEQWKELKVKSQKLKVVEKPKEYSVDKNLYPDVWCSPGIVVEIEADNITKSPIHTAGYALRFPRLIRFRDDKDVEQATTLTELEEMYRMQK